MYFADEKRRKLSFEKGVLRNRQKAEARLDGTCTTKICSSHIYINMTLLELNTAVKLKETFQWLSPLEPMKRHFDVQKSRLDNTGKWLLEEKCFEEWRDGRDMDDRILCCYGMPGAGKTVMR